MIFWVGRKSFDRMSGFVGGTYIGRHACRLYKIVEKATNFTQSYKMVILYTFKQAP